MNKLVTKTKRIAVLKIIFAVFVEILVIYMMEERSEDISTIGRITCTVLWTFACAYYFISGINALKNHNKVLHNFLKENNITMRQLDTEIKSATKIGTIYIGTKHIFSHDNSGIVVLPIVLINKLEIVRFGYNPLKGKKGYYYLYIYSSSSEKYRRIYSVLKNGLIDAADEIIKINKNIECINIHD